MALARGIKVLDQARVARVDRARYRRLPVEILISNDAVAIRRRASDEARERYSCFTGIDGALPGQHRTAALEPDQIRRQ